MFAITKLLASGLAGDASRALLECVVAYVHMWRCGARPGAAMRPQLADARQNSRIIILVRPPAHTPSNACLISRSGFSLSSLLAAPVLGAARRLSNFPQQHVIALAELKALLAAKDSGLQLIDVREPAEYAQGFIPTAINIPGASLPCTGRP